MSSHRSWDEKKLCFFRRVWLSFIWLSSSESSQSIFIYIYMYVPAGRLVQNEAGGRPSGRRHAADFSLAERWLLCQPHLLWCPPCSAAFGGTFSRCRHVTALPWQPYSCLSQTILWIKRSLRSFPAEWISCWMHCRARWQMSVIFFFFAQLVVFAQVCSYLLSGSVHCCHVTDVTIMQGCLSSYTGSLDRSRRWSQRWGICNIIMIFWLFFCSFMLQHSPFHVTAPNEAF